MKKLLSIITITVITAFSFKAQAQKSEMSSKPVMFSIGVEPSLPIGKFHDAGYNFGIGGSLQVEDKVASELGLTLNAGYMHYSAKDITLGGVTVNGGGFDLIPVMAGAKYHFTPMVYAHGQLGAAFSTTSGGGTSFAYSPGVGFMVSKNFDILLKYQAYSRSGSTSNTIGARLAYSF